MAIFPSGDAMIMVFHDDDVPNSLVRSALIIMILFSTFISTFFIFILIANDYDLDHPLMRVSIIFVMSNMVITGVSLRSVTSGAYTR